MSTNVFIDFNWIYNKYYYVSKERSKSSGTDFNSTLAGCLVSTFKHMIRDCKDINNIFVVLDGDLSNNTLKRDVYPEYKAGRSDKKDVYESYLPILCLLGSLSDKITILRNSCKEADEVIAYLVLRNKKTKNIIYSGDKDFFQLTHLDNTKVADKYSKGKFSVVSDTDIFNKFKNSKKEPFTRISESKIDLLKYRILKGDVSDNIKPPIPRLTDENIKLIIQKCWNNIYLDIHEVALIAVELRNNKEETLADKFIKSSKQLIMNYKLMSLMEKDRDEDIKSNTKVMFKNTTREKLNKIKKAYNIND